MAVAAIAADLNQSFDLPIGGELRRDVVNVIDVARAMIHTAEWYIKTHQRSLCVFNVTTPKILCTFFFFLYVHSYYSYHGSFTRHG